LTQAGFKPVCRCAAAEGGEFVTDQHLYTMENRLDNYPSPAAAAHRDT
jgi:hypothetical protein